MKKTIQTAQVALNFNQMNASELVTEANGVKTGLTGNTDLPSPPVLPAAIGAQVGLVITTLGKIAAGDTSTSLTRLLEQQCNSLIQMLISDGHYVEDTANTTAAGDLARAEQIILGGGYKLKTKGATHPRAFEVVGTSEGSVHYRTLKGTKNGYKPTLWRYGITDAKGKPPDTKITHFTKQVDVVIDDLPSNSIVAMQNADAELSGKTKKFEHPSFSHNTPDPYDWSDFIYTVVP